MADGRLPGGGGREAGRRYGRAGQRAHLQRQDGGGRVRGLPRAAGRRPRDLHHPAESTQQPEVPRLPAHARFEKRRSGHRREHDQRLGAGGRDDDRDPAQPDLRGPRAAGRCALRGARRGPLHRRLPARFGVGGGHRPGAPPHQVRRPVGHHRQLRGGGRLDGREPGSGGDRLPRAAADRAGDVAGHAEPLLPAFQHGGADRSAHVCPRFSGGGGVISSPAVPAAALQRHAAGDRRAGAPGDGAGDLLHLFPARLSGGAAAVLISRAGPHHSRREGAHRSPGRRPPGFAA